MGGLTSLLPAQAARICPLLTDSRLLLTVPIIPEFLYDIRHPNETVLAAELAAEQAASAAAAAAAAAAMTPAPAAATPPPQPLCPNLSRPPDNGSGPEDGLEFLNNGPGEHGEDGLRHGEMATRLASSTCSTSPSSTFPPRFSSR